MLRGKVLRTVHLHVTVTLLMLAAAAVVARPATAQDATPVAQEATPIAEADTPVATPMAGGVACTDLFGIAAGNACLLVLHGSRDAGPLDVYLDGALVIPGTGFGGLGDFVPVAAGEHQVQFVPSGAAPDAAILTTRADLQAAAAYEVSALGPVEEVRALILPVDTRPLTEDRARIRLVHGSTAAPAVDLALTGGVPLISGVTPEETSGAIEVPSGTYALEVRVAGTDDVLLPLPGTNLFPNTTYTLYLTGSAASGSLGVTLVPVLIPPELAPAATPVA